MIEPRDHFVHGLDRGRIGRRGPAQYDHLDAERARRCDFAVARGAAAVLGDHRIDRVRAHQRAVVGCAERSAIGDIADAWQGQRWLDRIDAADQIQMLRSRGQWLEFRAAERDKDPARPLPQSAHGISDIACFDPAVAGNSAPWRPPQHNQRHSRVARGRGGIRRNDIGVRMSRVDDSVDPFVAQIVGKTGSAAEAATADRHRLRRRRLGAAGQRHDDFKIGALGQALGQFSRFRGTAEDKDA